MTKSERAIAVAVEQLQGESKFVRDAAAWLIAHVHLASMLYNPKELLSEEELERLTQKAIETEDFVFYGLLVYQKAAQERGEWNFGEAKQ